MISYLIGIGYVRTFCYGLLILNHCINPLLCFTQIWLILDYSNIHNNPLFELLMASLILGKRRDYIYGKTEYRSTWQKKDYLRLRNKANQNETLRYMSI